MMQKNQKKNGKIFGKKQESISLIQVEKREKFIAKIEALKAGTTKINVKVTLNNSDWSTIIPVTVTATPSEDGSNESGTDTDGNKEEGKTTSTDNNAGNKGNSNGKNGTEATENISQAGSNAAIVLFVIAGFGIVAVISKKKLTKNRF